MKVLGIDIGGTGIKGAIVDTTTGELITERVRIQTPQPATPGAVSATVKQLTKGIGWTEGAIGVGFPAIVQNGICLSASNIDNAWIGTNIAQKLETVTNCPVTAVNDADAAGIAAANFGLDKGVKGVVLFLTLGTGIGSALFLDGKLVPNTELGHLYFKKGIAEDYASNTAKKSKDLTWSKWGGYLNKYLNHVNRLFSPNLILIGGGLSKKYELYKEYITTDANVKVAELKNEAGIIGAAYYAAMQGQKL